MSIQLVHISTKCVKLHRSFTTISLCLCGAVDWSFDSGDGTKNLQLGSTLMVSIYTPCQPLPN